MKILICAFSYLPEINGISVAVSNQHKILSDLGYFVDIATGLDLNRTNQSNIFEFNIKGTGRIGNSITGEVERFKHFLTTNNYDLLFFHCWEIWSTELAISTFEKIKGKKVIFSHGTSFNLFSFDFNGIVRFLTFIPYRLHFYKRLRKFDYYVFLTKNDKLSRFSDFNYIKRKKIKNFSIIPNIADPRITIINDNDFKSKFKIKTLRIILCVANFQKIKRQREIIKIFQKSKIEDTSLVLIGSNKNDYYQKLKTLADVDNNIVLLDNISKEDIYSAYKSSDVFILFSKTEAQPLVLLDCMASKLPFVSSDVGCVEDFKGGVVVNNEKEAIFYLKKIIFDQNYKSKLIEEGYSDFIENYSYQSIKEKHKELLKNLLQI